MKKRMLFWVTVLTTVVTFSIVDDPLKILLNFIIGGLIPNTEISLGLFPSIAVMAGILLLVQRWTRKIRLESMARTALEVKEERTKTELLAKEHSGKTEPRNNSVIAATAVKQIVNL
jgi:hypothetical protein